MRAHVLAVAMLLGCSRSSASVPAASGPLHSVPELAISVGVPPGARVEHHSDSLDVDLNPGMRRPLGLSLARAASTSKPTGPLARQVLPHGARLAYSVSSAAVGSGGPEAFLDGILEVGTTALRVKCHVQVDDLDTPDPAWCLPLLDTIVETPPRDR
jgi:hypothetical protein